jgi:hypothetical protein
MLVNPPIFFPMNEPRRMDAPKTPEINIDHRIAK